jgi:hypothetical protein
MEKDTPKLTYNLFEDVKAWEKKNGRVMYTGKPVELPRWLRHE